jgi:hypothetical protein
LKPVDADRGNRKIFFDAPNRGSKRILSFLNDAPAANDPTSIEHAGNGFLMRQGYTIVWCGWQGDLIPAKNWLVMGVPVATDHGKEIIRKVRTEIVVTEKGIKSQPLSGDERVKSYEAASLDKNLASLSVRQKSYGKRIPLSPAEWEFSSAEIDAQSGRESIKPSSTSLYLRSGYTPGHIYEFIYPAKNPLVLGLGLRRRARFRLISPLRNQRHGRTVESSRIRQKNPWHRLCARLGSFSERQVSQRLRVSRI